MKQVDLKQVKNGEFFRLKESESAPVWVRGDYDRGTKTFSAYKFEDINHETFMRGTRKVFIDFIF